MFYFSGNLCYEMQKVSLRPSIEDDDLQESSENIIEKNYQTAKTAKVLWTTTDGEEGRVGDNSKNCQDIIDHHRWRGGKGWG